MILILNFFDAGEFCFDANFGDPFFYAYIDFPFKSTKRGKYQHFDRKMDQQNLHQNKIRERQKNSKSSHFVIFDDFIF